MHPPSFEAMIALGETFRYARESQGLSLAEIADRIHIRSAYLAAIESEDWKVIGPPVYVRGFLRSYARALGLDADAAVARYSTLGPASTPVLATPRGEPSRSGQPRGDVRKPGLSLAAIAGLVVACALVAFVGYEYYDYTRGVAVVSSTSSASAPPLPATTAAPTQPAVIVPLASAKPEHPAARGLALRLRANSWLRVTLDGKVALEGIYPKGTARSFSARRAIVRAGNAGGVDVLIDGRDLGPMGGFGDVAQRSFQL